MSNSLWQRQVEPGDGQSCRNVDYDCSYPTATLVLISLYTVSIFVYFVYYIFVVCRVFRTFYQLPYTKYRMGNLVIRMQVHLRGIAFAFFPVTALTYHFVRLDSCASYIQFGYGLQPMQLVATVLAIANGFLATPRKPDETAILQVWLQEFAWTGNDYNRVPCQCQQSRT